MSISTRVLTKQNQQASGRWRVREVHTDALGVDFNFQYLTAGTDVAEATTKMNSVARAAETLELMRERDRQDALDWALAGNDPEAFDLTNRDITIVGVRRKILRHFVTTRSIETTTNDNRDICTLAPWVAARPIGQIENTLGVTTVKATAIRDRGVGLRDNLCPALIADDADQTGIEDAGE